MRLAALLLAAAGLLAACATPPSKGEGPSWLSGRMNVRVEASPTAPARSDSVDFELRGAADSGELRLSGPLGVRLATARWAAGQVTLTTSEGERQFDSLDALSTEALGEALPLAAWPDWLAGRPWPGALSAPTAQGFDQLGWQVNLARRADGVIEARRPAAAAAPAVLVRVRLEGAAP